MAPITKRNEEFQALRKKKRTYINRQKYLLHCQGMVWIYARHTTIHLASNEYIIFKHIKFSMRSFFSNGAAPFVLFSFTLCANLASFQPTQNFVFYMSTVFKFVYHDDLAKTFTYSIHSFISIFRARYSITIKYGVDLWNDEMTAINLILLLKITKKKIRNRKIIIINSLSQMTCNECCYIMYAI